MESEIRCWIALRAIEGVGDAAARRLAKRFGSAREVFDACARGSDGLPQDVRSAIASFRGWREVDGEISRARALDADVVCLSDPGYPRSLHYIFDPPPVLYVRGRLAPEDVLAIAIVGSRDASPYGLAAAEALARELAGAGVTVVSGLAIGIDAAAHRGALRAGGRTIAVLGSGIDRIYPERHRRLAADIAERGAVVSEFPIGTKPERGNFPRRNRIVSGLSLGVVVVEAGERSGSLITAALAADQGREVFAVPGEINTPRTRGTHRLLREGAALAESGADVILGAMPWVLEFAPENRQTGRSSTLPEDERKLLDCFDGRTMHIDHLIERSHLEPPRVLEILLDLEMKGAVSQHPGKFFSRQRS